ncbi:unnamed protein product [Owenia fusiformis]|uniref:Uncharacterized protein n=1 Tax=Owenia fusiformis TaxID=6347 RepID=A0A8J1Y137_OWEFU|nr:unnamed protein product [Owenia fusiformis]
MYIKVNFVILWTVLIVKGQESTGTFWQITDIHLDPFYSEDGQVGNLCHKTSSYTIRKASSDPKSKSRSHGNTNENEPERPGMFGTYGCDSPSILVDSAVHAMKQFKSDADFIVWTGDNIGHVGSISSLEINKMIRNITDLIQYNFPNADIFPVLGNHDSVPYGQLPVKKKDPFYAKILRQSGWGKTFNDTDVVKDFKSGGYYSRLINPALRLVGLNTALYYNQDELSEGIDDPVGQFKWLAETLEKAKSSGEKVMIIGHVPPGTMERVRDLAFYYPDFNKKFLNLVTDYLDVIVTQVFGHIHLDSFRLYFGDDGIPKGSLFLGPSVTSFRAYAPTAVPNNPSVRLYTYNRDTGEILDIHQYYLDLAKANEKKSAEWLLEYQATKAYNIPDLSPKSLDLLLQSFKKRKSERFSKYYKYNAVSYDTGIPCVRNACKATHICSISHLDYDEYNKYFESSLSSEERSVDTSRNKLNHSMELEKLPVFHSNNIHSFGQVLMAVNIPEEASTGQSTLDSSTPHPHHHHHHQKHVPGYMVIVIIALVVIVIILFTIVTLMCMHNRRAYLAGPRYVLVKPSHQSYGSIMDA